MSFDGQDYHCTFSRDITDRKKAEADVRRMRYSLDHMEDYPTWNDSQGNIIEVSDSTCRHLEYSRDELLQMTIFDICPDIDRQDWLKSWSTSGSEDAFRMEVHHRTKSGRLFPVEITIKPMVFDGNAYHCTFCRDISERKRLEDSLLLTQMSVEVSPDMVHWIGLDGSIIYANQSACDFLGYTLEELRQKTIWEIDPGLTPGLLSERWGAAKDGGTLFEETWQSKDGRMLAVEIAATNIHRDGEDLAVAFARDITERKLAEQSLKESEERYRQLWEEQTKTLDALRERDEQLLQAQKMEAIGRLAGGIAHDFNNVLTTIVGYSDLILAAPEAIPVSVAEDVAEIRQAAHRAGALTQRVLAFSRRQAMQPTLLSLNDVVADTEKLLARTIGADIELATTLSPDLDTVRVDEQQFVQVLLNLAVNARDAMPKGGRLTIATANVELDERFCATRPELDPGPYVTVTVSDTGTGIEEQVLTHIFEPFYTTKPPGLGTGLGLATVYGIVAQSGGSIYASSASGQGATFTIYLPREPEELTGSGVAGSGGKPFRGTAQMGPGGRADPAGRPDAPTLVVVDSDAAFLILTRRILERRGFKVLPAGNGEQAAKLLNDRDKKIDGLVTELALSGTMQGEQVAALAAKARPGLKLLFISADAEAAQAASERAGLGNGHLGKPFTAEELEQQVRTWHRDPEAATAQREPTAR
jgi:PAS domain S-box-containing protein